MKRGEFDTKVIITIVMISLLFIVLLLAAKRIFGVLG